MERSKPVIGVTPLYDDERDSVWMLPGYLDAVVACGGLPLILPLTPGEEDAARLVDLCDGILFTGGHDVDPALYQEERLSACGPVHAGRDALEFALLQRALVVDLPVLGICRGMQFINVALGGTLYQDLPTQMAVAVSHHMTPPYDRPWHEVSLVPGTPLYFLLKKTSLQVNSYHHQGIRELSFQLSPMAYAPDSLIEAFYHPMKRFTWGVQWHPEFLWEADADEREIMQAFVDASTKKANGERSIPLGRSPHRKGSPFLMSR